MKRQVRASPKRDLEEAGVETNENKRAKLLVDSDQGNCLEVDEIKAKSSDHLQDNGSYNGNHEIEIPVLPLNEHAENKIPKSNPPEVSKPDELISSKVNENGSLGDSSNSNISKVHNGVCDEVVVKSSSTDPGITSEMYYNDTQLNPVSKKVQSSDDSMPVLNAENIDVHNSESRESFQSEGFETTKSTNQSETKDSLPCPSQEAEKNTGGESSTNPALSNIDIDSLTLSHLEVTQLEGHPDVIYSVAADEDIVLSSSGDTTVKVWNMIDKSLLCNFSGHKDSVTSLLLLSQSQSDLLQSKLQATDVSRIAITGSLDCQIKLWSVLEGHELASIYTFNGITCIGYLESESYVVVGTEGGKLELWDVCTSKVIQSVHAHEDSVSDIKVVDCNIYSVSTDGAVKVWLFEDEEMYPVYTRKRKARSSHDESLGPAQWKSITVSNNIMYLGDNTSSVKVLDSVAGRLRLFQNQVEKEGICECVAAGKDILLTSFYDSSGDTGGVNVWKIPDMAYICTLSGEVQDVCSLAIMRKAELLRIVTGGHQLLVWDFDFSRPPKEGSQDSHHAVELDIVGREISENTTQVNKNDSLNQSINSNPEENPNNRWCNVM